MAAGVPHQPHRPSPAEGEQQRGGAKQAGQKNQTQNPHRHVVLKKKEKNENRDCWQVILYIGVVTGDETHRSAHFILVYICSRRTDYKYRYYFFHNCQHFYHIIVHCLKTLTKVNGDPISVT